MSVSVDDLIRGKCKVERVLGERGFGVVFAAWDPDLERHVAIKVLKPDMLVHPEIVQRFLREARAAAKIQSDDVAHVVQVAALDDGSPFIVMEYLEGHDLARVVVDVASAEPPPAVPSGSAPTRVAAPPTISKQRARPLATAVPAATVNCNPPYVVDGMGLRTRKPQCK